MHLNSFLPIDNQPKTYRPARRQLSERLSAWRTASRRVHLFPSGLLILSACLLTTGCVLFDDVTYEEQDTDYWSTGVCPGNSAEDPAVVSTDCRGITMTGCCDANGNTLYCYEGLLLCKSCVSNVSADERYVCSWSTDENGYWCTFTDNGIDPSGVFQRACPAFSISR